MLGNGQNLSTGLFEHHLLTRNQRRGKIKKNLVLGLMLTSLVDMFSMLVCFLLQTFSSTPEVFITKGLSLPDSSTSKEIKEAPVLSVTRDEVFLDQKLMGTTVTILKDPNPLVKKLKEMKTLWVKSHPSQPFPGEINFQADKEVESVDVSRIMGVLTTQQYSVIKLAVVNGGN